MSGEYYDLIMTEPPDDEDVNQEEEDEDDEPDDYFDKYSPWNYAELREMRGIRNEY